MRRRLGERFGLAVILAVCAGGAWAASDDLLETAPMLTTGVPHLTSETANAPAAAPVTLFHYFNLDADCRPTKVSIEVTQAPAHGDLAIVDGEEQPALHGAPIFAKGDPRERCANRLVATRDGVYTSAAGYEGDDRLVVEFREGDETFQDAINLEVRAAPGALAPAPKRHSSRP
ncbi:MAG: hypothetical protein ACHP7N_09610 [Caulobacterales bacterium]